LPSAPPWPWAPPRCPRCRSRKVCRSWRTRRRGTGNGIMETISNYGYDIIMLVALLVVASMFIGVCYHAYGTYAEIHTGRKTWGQFGLTVAIGAVLLVIGIWLLTEATGIL
jgi:integrating conjugative element membrane protein (TIGR03745 family)